MPSYRTVTTIDQIPPATARSVDVDGRAIALFNLAGTVYAIADECSHEDAPLSEGEIEGDAVVCPWHLARFEIKTGRALSAPACADVDSFPVRIVDGVVQVSVTPEPIGDLLPNGAPVALDDRPSARTSVSAMATEHGDFAIRIAACPAEVAEARRIRRRVFVEEQAIPRDLDEDGFDASGVHALVYEGIRAVATGRLVITGPASGVLARIAVLPEYRRRSLGRRIVAALEAEARSRDLRSLSLHPHAHLEGFYHQLGYRTVAGTETVGNHVLITMVRAL